MAAKTNISWWKTEIGDDDLAGITESLRSRRISQGCVTEELEIRIARAVGAEYALVTTSGTAALYLGLKACGIGQGDEVLMPSCTWVATAHAAMMTGAIVSLVDCDPLNGLIDPEKLADAVTPKTRALIPVHLNGNGADMDSILDICLPRGIVVVEDACQAFLSHGNGRTLGTVGDIGCYSLGLTKLITTGQGGVAVTDSEERYNRMRMLRNHGVEDQFADIWTGFGFNFKFTDLLAGMGLNQLEKSTANLAASSRNYERYSRSLPKQGPVVMVPLVQPGESIPLYCEATCLDRDATHQALTEAGIESRPVPPCLHTASYLNPDNASFPNADIWQSQTLILPCGPGRTPGEIDEICGVLNAI